MEARPKPIDQSHVGGVAKWLSGRIGSNGQFQAHDSEEDRGVLDRKWPGSAPLDPTVLRTRNADRASDVGPSEPSIQPGAPKLSAQRRSDGAASGGTDVDGSLTGSHGIGSSADPLTQPLPDPA
jgi:hypothetical protein